MPKKIDPTDIVGQKFTRWTVQKLHPEKDEHSFYQYDCVCDCGTIKTQNRGAIMSGRSKSCGCLNKELTSVRSKERSKNADVSDMIGTRFGQLIVVRKHDIVNSDHKYPYVCKCDCGGEVIAAKNNLVAGRTKSCGCLHYQSLVDRHQSYRDKFDSQEWIGKTFGKLVIVEYVGYRDGSFGHCFKCSCACGGTVSSVALHNLKKGNTKTCGCSRIEFYAASTDEQEKWLNEQARKSFTRSLLREEVLDRDQHKCVLCGCLEAEVEESFECHHVEPWKTAKELRFESDNLVSLCWPCHFLAHKNVIGQGVDEYLTEKFKIYLQKFSQQNNVSINGLIIMTSPNNTNEANSAVGAVNVH